jgi:hypothetical protein
MASEENKRKRKSAENAIDLVHVPPRKRMKKGETIQNLENVNWSICFYDDAKEKEKFVEIDL